MIEKSIIPGTESGSRSSKNLSTWILLDFSRFAISKLRDMELASKGLTPEQTAMLKILINRNGRTTISDIATYWMRQPHSVSTLINRMVKQGMVEKVKHPKQKEFEIVITEKGRYLHNILSQESIDEIFSTLTMEDLQKISQYLQILLIKSRKMLGYRSDLPVL